MAAVATATSKKISTGRFIPQFQLVNAYAPRNSNYCAVQLYQLRNSPLWTCDTTSNDANHEHTDAKHQQREAPFEWIRLPFLPHRYLKHHHYPEHIRSALRCAFLPGPFRITQVDSHRSDSDAPNKTEASSSPDNPLTKRSTHKPVPTVSPSPPPSTLRFHNQPALKTVDKDKVVSNTSNTNNDNPTKDNNNKDNNKNNNNNDIVIGTFRNPSGKVLELLRNIHNNSNDTPRNGDKDVYVAGFRNPPEELIAKLQRLLPELPEPSPRSFPTTSPDSPPQDTTLADQTNSSNQPNWAGQPSMKAAPLANSAPPIIQREQPTIAAPLANRAPRLYQREQPTIAAPLANRAPLHNREQPTTTTAPNSFRQALNSDPSLNQDSDDNEDPAPESTATLHPSLNPFDCSIRELKIQWEKKWREMANNQLTEFIYSMTHPEFTLPDDDACSVESTTFPTRSTIGIKPTTEKRHHPHARRKPTRKHSQHNQHSRPRKTTSWKNPVRASFIRRPHFRSTPPSTTTPRKPPQAKYSPSPPTAPVPTRFDGYAPNTRPSIWNKPVSYKHEPPDTLATGIRVL